MRSSVSKPIAFIASGAFALFVSVSAQAADLSGSLDDMGCGSMLPWFVHHWYLITGG